MKHTRHYLFICTTIFVLCTGIAFPAPTTPSGADYLNDSLPAQWSYRPEMSMEIPSPDDSWWQTFEDSYLDTLITLGINNNYNLAIVMHRTQIARNDMMQAHASWFPSITLNAEWNKSHENNITSSQFSAGLSASWEIDIFGKIASGVKAKKAGYMASRAEYAGAMVSICAQIASTYVQLRMYQELLDISNAHSERQMKIADLAKARYEAELASKLDVAQALELYYSTSASVPMLKNSIHTAINSLAILTGTSFNQMNAMLGNKAPMPNPTQLISAGMPLDLLRRRPDIIQAEMELSQYAAQIGIAKKDFLPTLTLNGSIGTTTHNISDMFTHDSFTYTIAPTLSWTIFNGLSRKYALASAKQEFLSSIDSYNLTVATAVSEVDNAMSTYYHSLQHVDAILLMIEQNDESLRLSIEQYKNSLCAMSDVVTAQLNSLSAESEMVSSKGAALSALINLYEALGGGITSNNIQSNN